MAFGMNTGGGSGGGEFLGRINYDVRVGFWKVTDRIEEDGRFVNKVHDLRPDAAFLFDYGSFEFGYIKIDAAPAFVLAPWGQPTPTQPTETKKNDQGKDVPAFNEGFRVKVMGQMFGDGEPRYFSGNSATLNDAVDALIRTIEAAPEAAQGMVPVLSSTGKKAVPKGKNTFYAPVFQITKWVPRPERLGERLVPPPAYRGAPVAAPAAPPAAAMPPPPPAAAAPLAERMPF